ncbi:SUF system Fe-S cluster assembly protein [Gluconacetobacter azotocaptans]|uniref:SUF system Fe-S cluster assembly protein n=1 Tax=Gluconacetobacter azotocaptans TaxID=142834 RepID=UPI00195E98F1|nr:SUF system Fe-S cluster assembly protein [Gluconacetobacter azotocaptans]MBM9402943.1 SUF system Fe-S cluster assembly protein [Gluconacetobacter azotocaptans]
MDGPDTRQGAEGFSFDPPAEPQGRGSGAGAVESWTPGGEPAEAASAGTGHAADEDAVIAAIASVYDPEIPVNIYELGLIYAIDLHQDGGVHIEMTLTAPNCPSAQELPVQVQEAVQKVDGVTRAEVEIVWDPPWDMSRMSDDARLTLNMF